jgi:hypothetical protein
LAISLLVISSLILIALLDSLAESWAISRQPNRVG